MPLIQVDGLSGTGKSTLSEELVRRGHRAVDADAAFAYFADPTTGAPTLAERRSNWKWDGRRLLAFAEHVGDDVVFVCGGALNADDFRHLFTTHFTLVVDDDTLRHRILTRTNNDFGKDPDDLATQLAENRTAADAAAARGSIVIDAMQPVTAVADEVIRRAIGPVSHTSTADADTGDAAV